MSKYGYLKSVSEGPFNFEIMRIDCIQLLLTQYYTGLKIRRSNKDNLGIIIKISS